MPTPILLKGGDKEYKGPPVFYAEHIPHTGPPQSWAPPQGGDMQSIEDQGGG
jgi:hypothetical protein